MTPVALIAVPLIIYISRQAVIKPLVLFISLAFGISIGSTFTPIGNPQNLLIALQSGISLPFTTFIIHLTIPTIINLFLTYFILRMYFKKDLIILNLVKCDDITDGPNEHKVIRHSFTSIYNGQPVIENLRLAKISSAILLITIAGFIVTEFLHFFHIANIGLSTVALLGAGILYLVSGSNNVRKEILRRVDYTVLVFFAAMFVVMSALWSSGAISTIMSQFTSPDPSNIVQSNAVIAAVSLLLSQILSNVPFVAIYNLVMLNNGFVGDSHINQWMMLASASTIAGNLTILGAASNIIIINAAESRGSTTVFTYVEFFKIGAIVTIANISIYYLFLTYF
jgi:Na+/H+ antiporter NhaD/arsenite permease-like protein